jgi:hypothetical protein
LTTHPIGWWSTPRPGRFIRGKESRYSRNRRLGGPQGLSGRLRKISLTPGFDLPNRPARSESLYRLSYRSQENMNNFLHYFVGKQVLCFCHPQAQTMVNLTTKRRPQQIG